jgi:hypothetical protein
VSHTSQLVATAMIATFISFMAGFALGHVPVACPTVHAGAAP